MAHVAASIRELQGCRPDSLPLDDLVAAGEPAVLRGLVKDWALVQAGLRGTRDAMEHLRALYNQRPVQYSWGGPEIAGRPFYNDDTTDLNFQVKRGSLETVLDGIAEHAEDPNPPTYYLASLPTEACLPGFEVANPLNLARHGVQAPASIWIGNRVTASCHYDAPNNIAGCAVGRRRVTVFPPTQIGNLYPGPLEPTPGGQAVSMVDFANPDLQRHPRFREALAHGQCAVLEPGDAIFIPSMWWHHVQGLEAFNVLVNYWWSSSPAFIPTPMHALYHAMWTIRDRPEREKQAWREVFEHYVFGPAERAGEDLPPAARGVLSPMDETLARQVRAMLIGKLNR
jgi:hypothetical protein